MTIKTSTQHSPQIPPDTPRYPQIPLNLLFTSYKNLEYGRRVPRDQASQAQQRNQTRAEQPQPHRDSLGHLQPLEPGGAEPLGQQDYLARRQNIKPHQPEGPGPLAQLPAVSAAAAGQPGEPLGAKRDCEPPLPGVRPPFGSRKLVAAQFKTDSEQRIRNCKQRRG